jgi:hypothetical protein
MKRILFAVLLISVLLARPTSTTNVVAGTIPAGTFQKPVLLTDGDNTTFTETKSIQGDNYIEFSLPYRLYLKQLKLIIDAKAYPTFFSIERSIEPGSYVAVNQKITPAMYPRVDDTFLVTVTLNNEPAQRIRISFPAGMVNGTAIRIAEVEIYPNMDEWPEARMITASVLADSMAEVLVSSNLDFNGELLLCNRDGQLIRKIPTVFFTRHHSVLIHDLQPQTEYKVAMGFTDLHANISETEYVSLITKPKSLAAEAMVTGTFVAEQPDDVHVVPTANPLARANDDNDSYFTSMVTSGDLTKQNQFLTFDFQKLTSVRQVLVFWRALAYSKDYSIEGSPDGVHWQTLKKKIDAGFGEKLYSGKGDPVLVQAINLNAVKIRYARISVAKGSKYFVADERWRFVQIMEVKFF